MAHSTNWTGSLKIVKQRGKPSWCIRRQGRAHLKSPFLLPLSLWEQVLGSCLARPQTSWKRQQILLSRLIPWNERPNFHPLPPPFLIGSVFNFFDHLFQVCKGASLLTSCVKNVGPRPPCEPLCSLSTILMLINQLRAKIRGNPWRNPDPWEATSSDPCRQQLSHKPLPVSVSSVNPFGNPSPNTTVFVLRIKSKESHLD